MAGILQEPRIQLRRGILGVPYMTVGHLVLHHVRVLPDGYKTGGPNGVFRLLYPAGIPAALAGFQKALIGPALKIEENVSRLKTFQRLRRQIFLMILLSPFLNRLRCAVPLWNRRKTGPMGAYTGLEVRPIDIENEFLVMVEVAEVHTYGQDIAFVTPGNGIATRLAETHKEPGMLFPPQDGTQVRHLCGILGNFPYMGGLVDVFVPDLESGIGQRFLYGVSGALMAAESPPEEKRSLPPWSS